MNACIDIFNPADKPILYRTKRFEDVSIEEIFIYDDIVLQKIYTIKKDCCNIEGNAWRVEDNNKLHIFPNNITVKVFNAILTHPENISLLNYEKVSEDISFFGKFVAGNVQGLPLFVNQNCQRYINNSPAFYYIDPFLYRNEHEF